MFASRPHNENVIYEQQTAAAAKPLNQVKGLAPKTPGNKPSKTPFNDENAAFANGKTGGKGKDGGLFGQGKGGKVDQSAFVTPAGPRTRAPLGNKTTNAKATILQTPAGTTTKPSAIKPTSPRLRRGKVKIHTAESDPLDNAEDEREIEYMAPREVPLPDHPDDWPHDRTYPQFEGKNLTRGWWAEFGGQKDALESDEEMSDFDEKVRKAQEGQMAKEAATKAKSAAERRPGTVKARGAASALSTTAPQKQRSTPGFAAPTAAAKARLPSAPLAKRPTATSTIGTGNSRYTAAKVASNTTLGYSKGRAVSASTRQPLSSIHEKPAAPGAKARNTTLDELLDMHSLTIGEDAEDDVGKGDFGGASEAGMLDLDDGLDDFQLPTADV